MPIQYSVPGLSTAVSARKYTSLEELEESVMKAHASTVERITTTTVVVKSFKVVRKTGEQIPTTTVIPINVHLRELKEGRLSHILIPLEVPFLNAMERPAFRIVTMETGTPVLTESWKYRGKFLTKSGLLIGDSKDVILMPLECDAVFFYAKKWRPCRTEGDKLLAYTLTPNKDGSYKEFDILKYPTVSF